MTRQEKLEALELYFNPTLEKIKNERDALLESFRKKETEYQDALIKYQNKQCDINNYYNAQDNILELQKLVEPIIE